MESQREISRKEYSGTATAEDIKLGCLQRIADASEKMASKYIQMENDLEYYKKYYRERGDVIAKRDKTISSLKGQITKLKKKINANPISK